MHPVRMPPLGTTSDEPRIVGWLKAEGEEVEPGEPLLEVETDKATLEVEAAARGTLLRIERRAGETVQVGALVGWIGVPGEAIPDAGAPKEAAPAVRKLARELGVDLAGVTGRGPVAGSSARTCSPPRAARPESRCLRTGRPSPGDSSVPRRSHSSASASRSTRVASPRTSRGRPSSCGRSPRRFASTRS